MAIQEEELRELVAKNKEETVLPAITTGEQEAKPAESTPLNETLDQNARTLNNILDTQKKVNQVKADLNIIVDSIAKNPSILTRVSITWGELPMWQKILGGVVLTVPTLTLGIVLHGPVLLAVTGLSAMAYTGSGVILDDHYNHQKVVTDQIKDGVLAIANLLGLVISALEKIHSDLKVEVEKFSQQNVILTKSVSELQKHAHDLQVQTKIHLEVQELLSKQLSETQKDLKETAADLAGETDKAKALNKELAAIQKDYAQNQLLLEGTLTELRDVKMDLAEEVKTAATNNVILTETIKKLGASSIKDAAQKENFMKKFEEYCNNKEAAIQDVAKGVHASEIALAKTEIALAKTNEELDRALVKLDDKNQQYDGLLEEHRKQQVEFKSLLKDLLTGVNATNNNNEKLSKLIGELAQTTNNSENLDFAALRKNSVFATKPVHHNSQGVSASVAAILR